MRKEIKEWVSNKLIKSLTPAPSGTQDAVCGILNQNGFTTSSVNIIGFHPTGSRDMSKPLIIIDLPQKTEVQKTGHGLDGSNQNDWYLDIYVLFLADFTGTIDPPTPPIYSDGDEQVSQSYFESLVDGIERTLIRLVYEVESPSDTVGTAPHWKLTESNGKIFYIWGKEPEINTIVAPPKSNENNADIFYSAVISTKLKVMENGK